MSTTPVITTTTTTVAATTGFNWKSLMSVIELAGNTAISLLVPGGPALAVLLAQLENAVNPLLQTIGTGQPASSETMTVYATIIGILTTLKNQPGLPAATLAIVDEYLIAAQNGTAAYIQAQSGYNPQNYQPVVPIV